MTTMQATSAKLARQAFLARQQAAAERCAYMSGASAAAHGSALDAADYAAACAWNRDLPDVQSWRGVMAAYAAGKASVYHG